MDLPADERLAALVVIALAVSMLVLGYLVTRAILVAANREPVAMVTVALSVLTMTAIGAYVLTDEDVMGTIAATGVGALASSVSLLFERNRDKKDKRDTIEGADDPRGEP